MFSMQLTCKLLAVLALAVIRALAGEGPFFVTYTHQMEEPGNLEIATKNVIGNLTRPTRFLGATTELEYGLSSWWTTEFYLDGQTKRGQSTLFTGYRWENRARLLSGEHWINSVLYVEFENINGADKTMLEIVNHDGVDDLVNPNEETRVEKKRELETSSFLVATTRDGPSQKTLSRRRTFATHHTNLAIP